MRAQRLASLAAGAVCACTGAWTRPVSTVTFQRGGGGTVATGNKVTFSWFVKGPNPNTAADRYITCQVPKPGSA